MLRSGLLLSLLLLCVIQLNAFAPTFIRSKSSSNLSMVFNFGGTKKVAAPTKIVISVDGKTIDCGDKPVNLRKELIANKIDVYPLRAKITGNCGGAGICGTCAVKVIEGAQNLNPPSKNEQNTLRNKPSDLRLSCCSRVNGPITIKTKP